MSQGNIRVVRDAFGTFNTQGIDAALSCFSHDLVWYTTDRWVDGSAYRGHDGMRTLTAAFTENFDDLQFDVSDVRDAQENGAPSPGAFLPTRRPASRRSGFLRRGGSVISLDARPGAGPGTRRCAGP